VFKRKNWSPGRLFSLPRRVLGRFTLSRQRFGISIIRVDGPPLDRINSGPGVWTLGWWEFDETAVGLMLSISLSHLYYIHINLKLFFVPWLQPAMAAPTTTLHPPRLAAMFAASPSAPGTPVHSIQTMRRKAAGHGGPLTKILVANRGVCSVFFFELISIKSSS